MVHASVADGIRRAMRRRAAVLAFAVAGLAALDLAFIALPTAAVARLLTVLAVILFEAGLVWFIGERYVLKALSEGVRSLEKIAADAEAERQHCEQLASAGRLAAGLAHEIGNPLCAITNYAHLLDERVAPEHRETVHALQREALRIERITRGLIDHARPQASGPIGADINRAIETVLRFLGEQGVTRRVDIERLLDDQPLPVMATAVQLEQVVANFVLNASDAMAGGGRLSIYTRRVARTALVDGSMRRAVDRAAPVSSPVPAPAAPAAPSPPRPRNERLHQWVAGRSDAFVVKAVFADSGHGVKRGDEERIFEPFVTAKPGERGSGLGLSVVRRLVNSMDGLVWVQPSREGGAAFHLVLPLHVDQVR